MREIRLSGSEGGGAPITLSLPLSSREKYLLKERAFTILQRGDAEARIRQPTSLRLRASAVKYVSSDITQRQRGKFCSGG